MLFQLLLQRIVLVHMYHYALTSGGLFHRIERSAAVRFKQRSGALLCAVVIFLCALLSVTAYAAEDEFQLTLSVNPEESGSFEVKVNGEEPMESTDISVKKGASVSVKAVPAAGYVFDHWAVSGLLAANVEDQLKNPELQFSMPGEKVSAEAYFKQSRDAFTVTVEAGDYGMGNFGHKDFVPGQTVSVEALPFDGYRFSHWVDLTGALNDAGLAEDWEKNGSLSFTMPGRDVVLSPEFTPITYYLTLKVVGEGEAVVLGKEKNDAGKYECTIGESLTLSASPGSNHVFVNWSATNSAQLLDYELKDAAVVCPASDFTVTATFASSIRSLTIRGTEGGTVNPEPGAVNVGVGNVISLTATPNEGYAFSHWECSSANGHFESDEDSDTNFTMPDEDCIVTAVFTKGGYRLTVAATAGGEASGKEGVYEMDDKVSIEAKALNGYVFSYWKCSVNGAVVSPRNPKTEIVIPGEDVKVTAVFVLKATLTPEETLPAEEEEKGFPWALLIVIFVVSAVAITLVILREQLNLSYRYLVGKWYEDLKNKLKKK